MARSACSFRADRSPKLLSITLTSTPTCRLAMTSVGAGFWRSADISFTAQTILTYNTCGQRHACTGMDRISQVVIEIDAYDRHVGKRNGMHQSVIDWVAAVASQLDCAGLKILEVGSYDVNGSVRPLFRGAESYTGIDFRSGPGVDIVMNAHALHFADESYDIVISTEMLEHDDEFWVSMKEMGRVLRKGGILIITARGNGFMLHDYPTDYWRFLPSAFAKLLELASCEVIQVKEDWQPGHPGVFGIGRKK
jgi:SAM-dependent methyltransferase